MSTATSLKGVTDYGTAQFSTLLAQSLITFFQWGFCGVGGFYNVCLPTVGPYGGSPSQLRLVRDNDYQEGQIWEAYRQDWVWETGVEYGIQPINVSGVYVDEVFYPSASTTGDFAHYVDYPQGRVVFDNPISPSSTVNCEYSFRAVQFTSDDQCPWLRELMFDSLRIDDPEFQQSGSGVWDVLSKDRVQLPMVVIEPVDNVRNFGMELGSYMRIQQQDVLCHVLAETAFDKRQLHDMLVNQYEMRINGFDSNAMAADGVLPLDYRGARNPSGIMYPEMAAETGVGGYKWTQIRFVDVRTTNQTAPLPLYWSTVRYTIEMDLP